MAILKGIVSRLTGSAGNLTFRRQGGATILSEKNTNVTNTRTAAQQKHRMKWANVIQMYKGISPLLNQAFENKPARVSDYNMFTKLNLQREPVYLTKAEVTAGACVVAPYQISLGSLPSIEVEGTGADGVTDISLGDTIIAAGSRATYKGLPQLSGATYEKSSGLTTCMICPASFSSAVTHFLYSE